MNIQVIQKMSRKKSKTAIQGKKKKFWIFDDIIADMISNKKLYPVVTELFIRDSKLYIGVHHTIKPSDVRLNTTNIFIKKSPNWGNLQQIAISYSSDIGLEDFIEL